MLTMACGKFKQKNLTVIHGKIIPAAGMEHTRLHGLWYVGTLLFWTQLCLPASSYMNSRVACRSMEHGTALIPNFHLYMLLYFQLTFANLDSIIYFTLFKFCFSKEIILFGYPQCHVHSHCKFGNWLEEVCVLCMLVLVCKYMAISENL